MNIRALNKNLIRILAKPIFNIVTKTVPSSSRYWCDNLCVLDFSEPEEKVRNISVINNSLNIFRSIDQVSYLAFKRNIKYIIVLQNKKTQASYGLTACFIIRNVLLDAFTMTGNNCCSKDNINIPVLFLIGIFVHESTHGRINSSRNPCYCNARREESICFAAESSIIKKCVNYDKYRYDQWLSYRENILRLTSLRDQSHK